MLIDETSATTKNRTALPVRPYSVPARPTIPSSLEDYHTGDLDGTANVTSPDARLHRERRNFPRLCRIDRCFDAELWRSVIALAFRHHGQHSLLRDRLDLRGERNGRTLYLSVYWPDIYPAERARFRSTQSRFYGWAASTLATGPSWSLSFSSSFTH